MTRPAPIIAGILAGLLLLLGAYMGAYYAMLKPFQIAFGNPLPIYRSDSELVRSALAPAHRLDRLMRPSYWRDE